MSTYVMADIHGCYDEYLEMIKKIDLKDEDTLYILGDAIDRGPHPIKVLQDMMCRPNVIFICGNHEMMALECFDFLMQEITDDSIENIDDVAISKVLNWQQNGSDSTLGEFSKLDHEEQQDVLDYMADADVFAEIEVNGSVYVLVHAGFQNFSPDKAYEDYYIHELIWHRPDYNKVYFEDKFVVSGHTPTVIIEGNDRPGYIMKKNNHIAIDCGAGFGVRLGCICLDSGEEFYVECNKE